MIEITLMRNQNTQKKNGSEQKIVKQKTKIGTNEQKKKNDFLVIGDQQCGSSVKYVVLRILLLNSQFLSD